MWNKHQNSLLHLEALWVDQQRAHQCSVTKSLTEQYSQWAASCIHITCILGKIERFARFMQHKLLMNAKACYSQILQYISPRRKSVKKEQIPQYIAAFAYITSRILIRNESGNLQELKFTISFALLLSHMPYSKSSDRLQILYLPLPSNFYQSWSPVIESGKLSPFLAACDALRFGTKWHILQAPTLSSNQFSIM